MAAGWRYEYLRGRLDGLGLAVEQLRQSAMPEKAEVELRSAHVHLQSALDRLNRAEAQDIDDAQRERGKRTG